jgi:hypothetical protein
VALPLSPPNARLIYVSDVGAEEQLFVVGAPGAVQPSVDVTIVVRDASGKIADRSGISEDGSFVSSLSTGLIGPLDVWLERGDERTTAVDLALPSGDAPAPSITVSAVAPLTDGQSQVTGVATAGARVVLANPRSGAGTVVLVGVDGRFTLSIQAQPDDPLIAFATTREAASAPLVLRVPQ